MRTAVALTIALAAACSPPQQPPVTGKSLKAISKGSDMAIIDSRRNQFVDYTTNDQAPEPPPIGIAIRFATPVNPAQFRAGEPVLLHGAYQADMNLLRLCKQGLVNCIMLTIHRADQPWGETVVLRASKIGVPVPEPADVPYDPAYRTGGQFHVDLAKFFSLKPEPGRYLIEAVIGPYVSQRLDFEIRLP